MEKRIFELLKPKAASLGFTKEELESVCESIAGTLTEEATDDQIGAAVDAVIPILKLSQASSARIVTAAKKKMEEEAKKNTPPTPTEDENKPKEEEKPAEQEPLWFKAYRESQEKLLSAQKSEIESLKKEKLNETLMSKALESLKDVDKNYYSLMLEGRSFDSEDGMNETVSKIKTGWETLCKERNIKTLKEMTPPGGGTPAPDKPNELVTQRIAERAAQAESAPSAIVGMPKR